MKALKLITYRSCDCPSYGVGCFSEADFKIINFELYLSSSLELFSKSNILNILSFYKFKTYSLFYSSDTPHTTYVHTTCQSNINLPLPISWSTAGHRWTTYQEALLWNNLPVNMLPHFLSWCPLLLLENSSNIVFTIALSLIFEF